MVWDRGTGRGRAPGDRVAGPPHRRRLRGAARARGVGARAHRARARRHLPGHQAALGARPRRTATSPTATSPRGCCTGSPASTSPTPATPAARCCARSAAATGTTSCSTCSASRARCCRRSSTPTRSTPSIDGIPVRAAAGDQQASLFGLRCWEPGTAKVTLGTGAFVLAQAGTHRPASAGRHPRLDAPGGAPAPPATRSRASSRPPPPRSTGSRASAPCRRPRSSTPLLPSGRPGPICVPAFQGFGSPTWDAAARGALLGLELGTTRADLARAVVDGIVHQVADAVEAIGTLDTLRIDGGLSRSDWIAQRLADLAGVPSSAPRAPDSTALGAATLAGLAAGVWDDPEAIPEIPFDLVAEPALAPPSATASASAGPRRASSSRATDPGWPDRPPRRSGSRPSGSRAAAAGSVGRQLGCVAHPRARVALQQPDEHLGDDAAADRPEPQAVRDDLGLLEDVVPERRRAVEAEAVAAQLARSTGRAAARPSGAAIAWPDGSDQVSGAAGCAAGATSAASPLAIAPQRQVEQRRRDASCRSACSAAPRRRRSRRTSASR